MLNTYARIRLLAAYGLLLLPFIVYGAAMALRANNNSPIDWVGPEFSARADYDHFTELFGPGDAVIAGWDECRVEDERLDKLVHAFETAAIFRRADGKPYFHSVICGRRTLLSMTSAGPADGTASEDENVIQGAQRPLISREAAIRRLMGTQVGRDGSSTCVILMFTREGLAERAHVVHLIRRAIVLCFSIDESEIHLAGPVIDGLTVDEASQSSLSTWAGPSGIVIFVICWISLRSFRGALLVFGTALFCQGTTLAIIHFSGETLSALLIIIPPLIQVIAVAGGIHLANYYFEALATRSPQEAAIHCFHDGWLPCTLSAATTAMGTASLMVSGLEPIRLFGVYSTVGVCLTAASVLTVIPCGLLMFPLRRTSPESTMPAVVEENQKDGWYHLCSFLSQRNLLSLTTLFGLMLAGAAGLPNLTASVRIETLFKSDHRLLDDYRWLEARIGHLVPIEVLITFDESCRLSDRQRMERLHQVDKAVHSVKNVSASTSALTFFPELPPMNGMPERLKIAAVNQAVRRIRPVLETAGFLKNGDSIETWRLTARCSAIEPIDYGVLLNSVEEAVRPVSLGANDRPIEGLRISTTGVMPLVHQIQRQLLLDLFDSMISALIVITITMTVVEAGVLNGLLAMMSNIFPIVLMFGIMGWADAPMDIGSVMTASVALGIAVDDTLHFLTFFRRSLASGMTRYEAVLFSYRHCGRAMIQTSVTCSLGLLVFAGSDFAPTSRFAVMMVGLLASALLGDLLLLPALLLSPFGRRFEQKQMIEQKQESAGTSNDQNSPTTSPP
ncbi:MAG: MMPL family transporter [Planctomyces sp.]|nr:MMPL family transporter [Planctomyces sp.]